MALKPHELRDFMEQRLIGQPHVIGPMVEKIGRYEAGMHFRPKPAGVFLLMGPSGVGKTLACELIAEALHGSRKYVLKVDCSEYQESHQIARLIGAPPGYLGHRETQAFFTQQKLAAMTSDKSSLSIVLFDEIEKADRALFKLLLGVLDKGELRLGDNTVVNFGRSLVFFTSNLGTRDLTAKSYTFARETRSVRSREDITEAAARSHFSPEFLGRVDSVITFSPLSRDEIRRILAILVAETNRDLKRVDGTMKLQLVVDESAVDWIIERGYSTEYGARELTKVWEKEVMGQLANFVTACAGTSRQWPVLRVEAVGGDLEFRPMGMEETLRESVLTAGGMSVDQIFGKIRRVGK